MRSTLGKPRRRTARSTLALVAILLLVFQLSRTMTPAATPPRPDKARAETAAAPAETPSALEQHIAELESEEVDEGTEVSRVLIALIVIILAAKLGGELLERVGQPAVLGELAFGVIIGNLNLLGYHGLEFLKSDRVVEILAELGVVLLLFEVGLESHLSEMLKVGLSSFLVACLGVIAPFFLGWWVAALFSDKLLALMPPSAAEAIQPYARYIHIFIGAVLCATSVGITARVLKDLGKIQTPEARIILGAAVFDDVLGLIILAVCVGIVGALGGGTPLHLDKLEQRVVAEQAPPGTKQQAFAEYLDKLLKGRKRAGYLYNVKTGEGRFVGREPEPPFREAISRRMSAIRSGAAISQKEEPTIAKAERLDALGFRFYEQRTEFSTFKIIKIILTAALFFVGIGIVGLIFIKPIFKAASFLRVHGVLLTSALMVCFLSAYIAQKIGLAPIVGAFAAGLILEDVHFREMPERRKHSLEELLAPLTTFLTPIFFVRMGIMVDLSSFANVSILGFALFLTLAAIVGKQVCAFGILERGVDRVAVGLGMIPRGEVGLIFANEGSKLVLGGYPVIDPNVLSAVVIMVMITTLVTPPVLKWKFGRAPKSAEPADSGG